MPGLRACGRRWDIGSDDLVFPAFGEVIVRTAWLVALAVVFSLNANSFQCNSGHLLKTYYIGMLVILSLHILLDLFIMWVSTRGTITNATPRKHMPVLVYLKLVLFLPEVAWTIIGTIWAFDESSNCIDSVVKTVKGAAIAGWILLFILVISIAIIFDMSGSSTNTVMLSEDLESSSAAKKMWELRCKVLCCCAGNDEHSHDAFNDIAELITQFFKGLDIVATDVAAGLVLLQIEQKQQPRRIRLEPLTYTVTPTQSLGSPYLPGPDGSYTNIIDVESSPDSSPQSPLNLASPGAAEFQTQADSYPCPRDWMNVPLAAHYMKFAMASYGWPLFMFANLFCGLCKLCKTCRCCACASNSGYVVEDNCCHCNMSAILQTTGIKHQDIIYASFFNRVYEIPFFVALDHEHQAVVVSIRGTLSLRDALTDLTADSEDVDVEGVEGAKAHRGILQAARFIMNTLSNMQLLHTAFRRATGYRLVITGHSLGAGAAAILSVLLRPSYPNLVCFAFSPPGWLVSLPLARRTESFVCSIVLGDDLVPRLGMINMERLKVQILKCVRDSSLPKYRILAGGVWYTLCGYPELQDEEVNRAVASRNLLDSTAPTRRYTEEQQDMEQTLEDAILTSARSQQSHTQLFMPGHILYIDEREEASYCLGTPTYQVGWARAEVFDSIIVSPKMLSDHLPDVVHKALKQLVERDLTPRHQVVLNGQPQNI